MSKQPKQTISTNKKSDQTNRYACFKNKQNKLINKYLSKTYSKQNTCEHQQKQVKQTKNYQYPNNHKKHVKQTKTQKLIQL